VAFLGERATVVGRRVRPLGMGRSRPDLGGAECDRPQPVSVGAPGLCEDWRQNAAGWAQFRRICLRRRSNEISQNAIIAPRPDVRPVAQSSCGPMTTFATQRTSAAPGNPSDRRMLAARSSLNDRHVSASSRSSLTTEPWSPGLSLTSREARPRTPDRDGQCRETNGTYFIRCNTAVRSSPDWATSYPAHEAFARCR
jgi:hypothetical protein